MRVGDKAMAISAQAARNLPITISLSRMGIVVMSSKVPVFFSSAMRRIVTAGTKITKSMLGENGAGEKKPRMSARPSRNRVLKNIHPEVSKNVAMTM